MKWLELLSDVGEHKAGTFIEVNENIHRSYIEAGLAKDGGDGPETILVRRSLDKLTAEFGKMVERTAQGIEAAATAVAKRPNVQGNGWEFNGELRAGESEADKSKSIGDFTRSTYFALSAAMTGDLETASAFHERLTKVYGVQRSGGRGDSLIQRPSPEELARSREQIVRNMTESSGSSLGYTTPVIYESMILKEAAEEQVFLNRARKVPLGARQVEWPALNQYAVPTAGQSAMFGGAKVYRKGEATQRTVSDVSTKKVILNAMDLTALFELSRDVLQDSTATLDAMIPQLGGEAIGWRADWEAWQGTGNGQFLGILNAPASILVTRNTSSHIVYQDVFKMYTRMLPRAKATSAWYVHPFAMTDILALKDDSSRNIYLPVIPGNDVGPIGQKTVGRLMGLPVIETEKMSQLGTAGDLALCAMDRYLHGERSGLEVGLSEHFLFDTDQVAIRLKVRNDGKTQLVSPIYLADGSQSNQVSAFIILN